MKTFMKNFVKVTLVVFNFSLKIVLCFEASTLFTPYVVVIQRVNASPLESVQNKCVLNGERPN